MLALLLLALPLAATAVETRARALELLAAERYAAAQPLIELLAREQPGAADVEYFFGRLSFELDDFAAAERQLAAAIRKDGGRADYHEWLGNTLGRLAQRSSLLRKLGFARRAKAEWQEALRLAPSSIDVRRWLVQFHLEAPAIAGGSRAEASRLADEIGRLDPYWSALTWARIHAERHDPAEQERALRRAIALGPGRREAHVDFGRFLLQANRAAEAEREGRAAIAAEPDHPEGVEVLVAALEQQRRPADALSALTEADAHARDEFDRIRYDLLRARVLLDSGQRLDEAERVYVAYTRQPQRPGMPPLAAAHWRLGQLYDRQGQRDKAQEEWKTALKIDPLFAPARESLKGRP